MNEGITRQGEGEIGSSRNHGIEVIRACNKVLPDMPVVVISVMAAEPRVLNAIEAGAKVIEGD